MRAAGTWNPSAGANGSLFADWPLLRAIITLPHGRARRRGALGLRHRRLRLRRQRERAAAGREGVPGAPARAGAPPGPGRLPALELAAPALAVDAGARHARPLPHDVPSPRDRAVG